MIDALNKLYEVVWQTECLPEGWKNSLLLQLDKKKPDKKDLANKRFIHMKEDIVKFFGHIVPSAAEPNSWKIFSIIKLEQYQDTKPRRIFSSSRAS